MITVIGIGNRSGDLTERAVKKIAASSNVFLRSAKTAAGKAVMSAYPQVVPLDDVFTSVGSFDELTATICEKLESVDKEKGEAVYLSDGDGMDECAARLISGGKAEIIFGVAANYSRGGEIGRVELTATEALRLKPYLDTALPLHITEIDDAYLAGELKLWLMEYYGDDTEVTLCKKGKCEKIELYEIDRDRGFGYDCELYIPAQSGFYKKRYSFGDLMRVMERLTAADGCPWDKAQDHFSIRGNMIEEAYEAVDAIDSGDLDAMEEEFGDVLLQAIFHCNMGERFGEFTTADVIGRLCEKLVFRHTHIFGKNRAANPDEALSFWEAAKAEEKSYVSTADKLARLPENFPSLLVAQKVYKKLIKAGVKPDEQTMTELKKEFGESEEECARKLFLLACALEEKGIDAEVVLSSFIAKIKREFAEAEKAGKTEDFLRKL